MLLRTRTFSLWLAALAILLAPAAIARGEDVVAARQQLMAKYAQQLATLAEWCDSKGLKAQAAEARGWLPKQEPLTIYLPVLTSESGPLAVVDAPADIVEWSMRWATLRRSQGEALFALAKRAVAEHQPALAYELVVWTVREYPNHEQARKMLGYQLHNGRWLTPFEINKTKAGQVWHESFGWVKADHLPRYQAGERFVQGRWTTPEADAKAHAGGIERGWLVMTEHYGVRTTHSLEEGARVAGRLEQLYRAWTQLFVMYYATEPQMAKWFDGGELGGRTSRMFEVLHYRDREEYIAALVKRQPNIGVSVGYYDTDKQQAHFYAGIEDRYLFHEATHQLFSQMRPTVPRVGQKNNFWVVEGVACYMESFKPGDAFGLVGGVDGGRLPKARYVLTTDKFFVPLAQFTALGAQDLQKDPEIARVYCQAAGLTHFLMQGDANHYRPALVDYLEAVYTGRDKPSTLAELTGESYAELDQQYEAFLQPAGQK